MSDEVKVKILGDDSNLQGTLSSAAKSVAKWSAAAVVASVAAGVAMTKSGLESADALAKESQQLGTTSKDLMSLKRAADMAGVSQGTMSTAARTLKTNLAQAAQGTGVAVDALKSLGLTVDDLSSLPLSAQIETINKALVENVDASERAAVASDLFGTRAGLAVSKISPDTIATASKQVRDFNAALSDVDAAKIENANDTMSQMGLLTQSVTQGLAVQFAPVLDAVAGKLFDAAKESDGFKQATETAFNFAVTGAGFVADGFYAIQLAIKAAEVYTKGMGVATVTVAETVVQAWDDVGAKVNDTVNVMIRAANAIPGIDIDELVTNESPALKKIKEFSATATANFQEAKDEFSAMWNEELPSTGLKAFVKEAQEASQQAAEAAVKAREAVVVPALEDANVGSSSTDDAAKEAAQKNLEAVSESLKTEAQLRFDAEDAAFQALIEARDLQLITKQEYLEKEEALNKKFIDDDIKRKEQAASNELKIAQATNAQKLSYVSSTFGALSSLMNTESRKLFEIGKASAIAQATVDGFAAVQKTMASVPYPFNIPLAAAQGVAAAANVAKISSTSFGSGGGGAAAIPSGGGAAESSSTQGASSSQSDSSRTLLLQGDFDKNSLYSGEAVRSLMDAIAEAQSDGYKVVL